MASRYLDVPGTYTAIVREPLAGWFDESAGKDGGPGKPFIEIPFQIMCAENPDRDGQYINWRGYLTDAAFENTLKTLKKAFGFNGDWSSLHAGKFTFVGLEAELVCETEYYNGKPSVRIKWVNNPDSSQEREVMPKQKADALVAMLARRTKALENADASPRAAAPKAASPAPRKTVNAATFTEDLADDDIPF